MPYRHLDEYLIRLEQSGDLRHIETPVSADMEISAITQRVAQRTGKRNLALWFEQVEGADFPVVTNLFGTERRMAWALGVDDIDAPRRNLAALLDMDIPADMSGILTRGAALMSAFRSMGIGFERATPNPFVQQVIESVPDVRRLPALRHWPEDSARALTMVQVISHDPHTDIRHVALARVEVRDDGTLGIPVSALDEWREHGDPLSAAVVLGGDPAAMWCAAAPRPRQIDPYLLAGWLRRRPVGFVPAVSQPVRIPADAEFAIEGVIDPQATYPGGIYGDSTGVYVRGEAHVTMRVTAITHRRDAVVPVSVPGMPPGGDPWAQKAVERLFVPVLQTLLDEVCDINLPDAGAFRHLAVVSIDKRITGGAHKVMHGLWGLSQLALMKTVIVLDGDVDIHEPGAIIARMLETVDFRRDLVVADGPLHASDPAAQYNGFGGKLGIDATRKPERATAPQIAAIDAEALNAILGDNWRQFGGAVIAAVEQYIDCNELYQRVWERFPTLHIALVDADAPLDNIERLILNALSSIDWRRDLRIEGDCVALDARHKGMQTVTVAPAIIERVEQRWREYGL